MKTLLATRSIPGPNYGIESFRAVFASIVVILSVANEYEDSVLCLYCTEYCSCTGAS